MKQRHHRDQPRPRHKVRVIEPHCGLRQVMRQSPLSGVLRPRVEASQLPSSQARGHLSCCRAVGPSMWPVWRSLTATGVLGSQGLAGSGSVSQCLACPIPRGFGCARLAASRLAKPWVLDPGQCIMSRSASRRYCPAAIGSVRPFRLTGSRPILAARCGRRSSFRAAFSGRDHDGPRPLADLDRPFHGIGLQVDHGDSA
jgi:hypothetical protein